MPRMSHFSGCRDRNESHRRNSHPFQRLGTRWMRYWYFTPWHQTVEPLSIPHVRSEVSLSPVIFLLSCPHLLSRVGCGNVYIESWTMIRKKKRENKNVSTSIFFCSGLLRWSVFWINFLTLKMLYKTLQILVFLHYVLVSQETVLPQREVCREQLKRKYCNRERLRKEYMYIFLFCSFDDRRSVN